MLKEREQPSDILFPVLETDSLSVFYARRRRILYVNSVPGQKLGCCPGLIFTELLKNPSNMVTYQDFFKALYPQCKVPASNEDLATVIRPSLCRLRHHLDDVYPQLSDVIHTVRQKGLVYVPHQSVKYAEIIPLDTEADLL